jgi:hypothetical protein
MVFDSSGCWAIDLRAWETAFPSPIAGAIDPIAIVRPATIIDVIPITVIDSI